MIGSNVGEELLKLAGTSWEPRPWKKGISTLFAVYELSTEFVGTGLYADGVLIRVRIGTIAPRVELLQSCIDVQVEEDCC